MLPKGIKRYMVLWEPELKYRDFKWLFTARLIYKIANADYIVDTKEERTLFTKTGLAVRHGIQVGR